LFESIIIVNSDDTRTTIQYGLYSFTSLQIYLHYTDCMDGFTLRGHRNNDMKKTTWKTLRPWTAYKHLSELS